jgi:hypothetical protein
MSICLLSCKKMMPTNSTAQRPFFARPEFLKSLDKPFELPIYIEPVAQALACLGTQDHVPRSKAMNSDALVYLDVEAEESECEGFSSPSSSKSSSSSGSTSSDNYSSDMQKL